MQDIVFLQCEKDLKIDFITLASKHDRFIDKFNGAQYIIDNPDLHLVNPQLFVSQYQIAIDAYLQAQTLNCLDLLTEKRYAFYSLLNKKRFFNLFQQNYIELFKGIDEALANETKIIQHRVMQAIDQFKDKEVH